MDATTGSERWYSTVYPPPDRPEHWTFAEWSKCTRSKLPTFEELGYRREEFDTIPREEGVFKTFAKGASAGAIKRAAWAASPVDLNRRPDISLAFAIIAEDKAARRAEDYKGVTGYVERDTSVFAGILYDVTEGTAGEGPTTTGTTTTTAGSGIACGAEGTVNTIKTTSNNGLKCDASVDNIMSQAPADISAACIITTTTSTTTSGSTSTSSGERCAAATSQLQLRAALKEAASRRRRAITGDSSPAGPALPTLSAAVTPDAQPEEVELALEGSGAIASASSAPVSRLNSSNSTDLQVVPSGTPTTISSSSSGSSNPRQRVARGRASDALAAAASADANAVSSDTGICREGSNSMPPMAAAAGVDTEHRQQGGVKQLAGQSWWRLLSRKVRRLVVAALAQGGAVLAHLRGAAKKAVVALVARVASFLRGGSGGVGPAAAQAHRCC
jgi:hypothetical protein